ncbi:cbb3-type cytochrome c oxidase subunit I [Lichenicoccus sp.]|uniref:cbb3-type cytochrome c oxidase subunit I n=1 Tax=Lichenicoccus sp. TaxID=2781899 RepID=UPI003D0B18C0
MNIGAKWLLGLILAVIALLALFVSADSGEAAVRTASLVVAVAMVLGVFGVLNWAFDDQQLALAAARQRTTSGAAPSAAARSLALPSAATVQGRLARPDARLVLAYFWASFLFFAAGIPLGFWQMWTRSPVPAPFANAANYYLSLTAHGVIEGYVLTTLFAMGFGYAVIATALERDIPLRPLAWTAFGLVLGGAAMTALTILGGHASVLYTFYPPLVAPATFYLGLVLVFVGSWLWVGQMVWSMADWKRAHARAPVPLAMFAMTGAAIIWAWTSVGATIEVLFQLLPLSLGLTDSIDIGLARTLFSWTLHGIVYFWLAPAYVAFYTLLPRAAGGRLYSDTMGRWSFIFLMVFGLPVGLHHLLMDPEHASAFKYIQTIFTAAVTIPTLLTIFTIIASLEIGGRVRAARSGRSGGSLGWVRALPWDRPMLLAGVLSLLMLGLGGLGGVINMSYALNTLVHNTAFIPAHFHLIFAGTTVIMYFAIAYEFWPVLTGRVLATPKLACRQLWLWFIGMFTLTLPWHVTGLVGVPRRMALFDYNEPMLAALAPLLYLSLLGGLLLVVSTGLFLWVLVRSSFGYGAAYAGGVRYAQALEPVHELPRLLNGYSVWNRVVACLMLLAYGYPLAEVALRAGSSVYVATLSGNGGG